MPPTPSQLAPGTINSQRPPPPTILFKIAFYFDDAATFFSFLEALGSAELRGPLEPLWRLGQFHDHPSLWPVLRLSETLLRYSVYRDLVEAIVQFYPLVSVSWAQDIDWLHQHLACSPTTIKWFACIPPSRIRPVDWFTKWVQLPIVKMDLDNVSDLSLMHTPVDEFLTQFANLTSLRIHGFNLSLECLFEFAARPSSKLVELDIQGGGAEDTMTTLMLDYAMQWTGRQNIRTFRFRLFPFDMSVNPALQEAFYAALCSGPKDELQLSFTYCPSFYIAPLSVSYLKLDGSLLDATDLVRLANVLPHSPALKRLRLAHFNSEYLINAAFTMAFARLFERQAKSGVTTLFCINCSLGRLDWTKLKPFLERCTLHTIALVSLDLTRIQVAQIAQALQSNNTIRRINLAENDLVQSDLAALLDCNLHRHVPLEMLRIRLAKVHRPAYNRTEVVALGIVRGVNVTISA
ncbi:Aste57867_2975 [Aphanomyces stellatus]|uniref:Aste57867_2975 protein n=1 Tax=Aphanomyces stellatus TaxID=120398 RepID=A0A485KB82_9STRA|nr:hypothetical protein As57867_002966 [Aphanomyces stellatus]VFT80157.1 Aste57867_2975 [Aphanomyces stellatus]